VADAVQREGLEDSATDSLAERGKRLVLEVIWEQTVENEELLVALFETTDCGRLKGSKGCFSKGKHSNV
jgi:hypothetical protein